MLRVWGGGVYEPRAFYDACDDFGIVLYHDLMFTWGSVDASINVTGTNSSASVRAELNHQLKRLSHHPSIVMWSACNECGGGGGSYDSIVMPIVAGVDRSRPIWPSSPSAGWAGGVDRLTARPNGKRLVHASDWGKQPDPPSRPRRYPFTLESHGPYSGMLNPYSAGGAQMPYVNASMLPQQGRTPSEACNVIKCPDGGCTNTQVCSWYASPDDHVGPGFVGWFRSEFGANAWSSFESMAAQLPSDAWSMSSSASSHRNWNVSNVINTYFGDKAVAVGMRQSGAAAFQRQLYQSMVSQLLFMKVAVEAWRSTNVFGTIFWMYNEVWPTGGWGSIEYGPADAPGQVAGGRWKPLQYGLKNSIFADRMAGCTANGSCFVANSVPFAFAGAVTVRLINVLTGTSTPMVSTAVHLPPGPGTTLHWFCAGGGAGGVAGQTLPPCMPWSGTHAWKSAGCSASGDNCALVIKVLNDAAADRAGSAPATAASVSFVPFQPPKAMRLPKAAVAAKVTKQSTVLSGNGSAVRGSSVPIILSTNATALYVVLTTKAAGRFGDNAFLLEAGSDLAVDFIPWETPVDMQLLESSLRVEHLADNVM